jgi:hypothetical protein
MNQSMHPCQSPAPKRVSEAVPMDERDLLTRWGFSPEEIASLLWLRQWYLTCGSDRAVLIRCLEFLRLLVYAGELEL